MIKNKLKNKIILPVMAAMAITGIGAGAFTYTQVASASTTTTSRSTTAHGKHTFSKGSGVGGTVTAVNGTSITLMGKNSTLYTVDASGAKFMKIPVVASGTTPTTRPTPVAITVSDIQVGDTLMVRGTVSGTSVVATSIIDGKFTGHARGAYTGTATGKGSRGSHVGGTITAINGNSITVSGGKTATPVVYTVDVSAAKVVEAGAKGTTPVTSSVSALTVGEKVIVRGTISGTSVTATSVIAGSFIKQ